MKVKELREILAKCDGELEIFTRRSHGNGCYDVDSAHSEIVEYDDYEFPWLKEDEIIEVFIIEER